MRMGGGGGVRGHQGEREGGRHYVRHFALCFVVRCKHFVVFHWWGKHYTRYFAEQTCTMHRCSRQAFCLMCFVFCLMEQASTSQGTSHANKG